MYYIHTMSELGNKVLTPNFKWLPDQESHFYVTFIVCSRKLSFQNKRNSEITLCYIATWHIKYGWSKWCKSLKPACFLSGLRVEGA